MCLECAEWSSDLSCSHRVCSSCYARLSKCPLCRASYLKLPLKLSKACVEQEQREKLKSYAELRRLYKELRAAQDAYLASERRLSEQTRLRVWERLNGASREEGDVLDGMASTLLTRALECGLDPLQLSVYSECGLAIERERAALRALDARPLVG